MVTADTLPRVPVRTDARVRCACGGTMNIAMVAPIPHRPEAMRHTYDCGECGVSAEFVVAKKVS